MKIDFSDRINSAVIGAGLGFLVGLILANLCLIFIGTTAYLNWLVPITFVIAGFIAPEFTKGIWETLSQAFLGALSKLFRIRH